MPAITKQPTETITISFNFAALLPQGAMIDTAIVLASRKVTQTTTLAAGATVSDSTVSLTAHPGVGALLTIDPSGNMAEMVKVTAVGGAGPFLATIMPVLDFNHSSGASVEYEPGVSSSMLVSSTATISGPQTLFRVRRGAANQTYRLSVIATLDTTDILEGENDVSVQEL